MALPIGKLAPTAVVAAVVTYSCWPHLVAGAAGKQTEAGKLLAIAAALLSPSIPEQPERDPFQALPNIQKVAAHNEEVTTAVEHEKARGFEVDAAAHHERWVLNATLLRGERRLAVINGNLYAAGDALAASDSRDSSYVVAQIEVDRVVIQGPGETTLDLRYEDGSSIARAAPQPKASAATRTPPRAGVKSPVRTPSTQRPSPKPPEKAKH